LKLYAAEPNNNLKRACIWLLEKDASPATTKAMVDHAMSSEVKNKSDMATEHYLLEALNKRLSTKLKTMDEMREHIVRTGLNSL
jgi:hypothetical protein